MNFPVKAGLAALALTFAVPTPALADHGDLIGGCTTTFTNPDAIACTGYYSGNLINGSPEDRALQAAAIAALGYPDVFDGSQAAWDALDPEWKIDEEDGDSPIDFGVTLFGLQIIGAHFGNGTEVDENNVSVFWLIDFGTEGGTLTLENTRGWSNAILYTPPGGAVPEPGTWAMMLMGFGAAGYAMRRRRKVSIAQVA